MVVSPDTIVALSSGRLPAGIAVLRVSGPRTRFVVETIAGRIPQPRLATFARFRSSINQTIDSGLLLFFPGPHSFTGEDSAEFHVHGGKAVVAALLNELVGIAGVRPAEAGEFTRRAFLNGKVDLLETEALADLIAAETEAQRRLALLNAQGGGSQTYMHWRNRLVQALAMIEAELDFADESDVPDVAGESVWQDVADLLQEILVHVRDYHRAEVVRDGFDVVIVGAPNAGKSSLLNALAKRDVAIVSDEPGTTRDLVEVSLDLGGVKVRLTDTAGIRDGAGKVEAIGISRAKERASVADLVLYLLDPTADAVSVPDVEEAKLVRLGTKCDLWPPARDVHLAVSSVSQEGLSELLAMLESRAVEAIGTIGDILPFRLRHVRLLKEAAICLETALQPAKELELRADDLRAATVHLGKISGAVDVEDLLDVIFSQFCIGK